MTAWAQILEENEDSVKQTMKQALRYSINFALDGIMEKVYLREDGTSFYATMSGDEVMIDEQEFVYLCKFDNRYTWGVGEDDTDMTEDEYFDTLMNHGYIDEVYNSVSFEFF